MTVQFPSVPDPRERKMERYAAWMLMRSEAFAGMSYRHFKIVEANRKAGR
jgi:hypothetical protein